MRGEYQKSKPHVLQSSRWRNLLVKEYFIRMHQICLNVICELFRERECQETSCLSLSITLSSQWKTTERERERSSEGNDNFQISWICICKLSQHCGRLNRIGAIWKQFSMFRHRFASQHFRWCHLKSVESTFTHFGGGVK